MNYLVLIYDYKNVLELRLKYRSNHLLDTKELILKGNIINAGAILENNKMIGSSLIVDFNSIDNLNDWLYNDPYTKGKVWNLETLQIIPLKLLDK